MEDAQVHVIGGGLGGLAAAAFVAWFGSFGRRPRTPRASRREGNDRRTPRLPVQPGPARALPGRRGSGGPARPRGSPCRGARLPRTAPGWCSVATCHLAPGGVGSLLRTTIIGVREKVELASLMARLPRLGAERLRGADGRRVAGRADRPGAGPGAAARDRAAHHLHERSRSAQRRGGDPAGPARRSEAGCGTSTADGNVSSTDSPES